MFNKNKKIIILTIIITIIIIFVNVIGVSANIFEESGTEFTIIEESYLEVVDWDGISQPESEHGVIANGWFKYKDMYYLVNDGKIVRFDQVMPTNYTASKGIGDILIEFHIEEGFEESLGVYITSPDEGVEAQRIMTHFNGYKAYFKNFPAGEYYFVSVFDGDSTKKLPSTKIFDLPDMFIVEDGKTTIVNVYSKDFYKA